MQQPDIYITDVTEDAEFEAVFDIRNEVFQEEHAVPEETEIDGHDHMARHFLAVLRDEYVGTGRWRITLGGHVRLERLAVLKPFRRQGVGRALMERMLAEAPTGREMYLHAPVEAAGFYEKLGFVQRSDAFEEAGLQHVEMYKP